MRSQHRFLALAAFVATTPVTAGVILSEVQEHSGQAAYPGAPAGSHSETELSAEGNGLRQDFIKSDSMQMPAGSYILYPADGLMYLVNPANRTYTMMDMATMMSQTRQMQQQSGANAPPAADKLVIDKKVDESGPVMHGLPTQHVVYEISYQRPAPIQVPGVMSSMEVHERYEIWATRALDERLADVPALRRSAGPMIKPVSDALASHGFALKQIVTSESRMGGVSGPMALLMHARTGRKETSSTVVTAIRYEPLPAERFALPQGYAEVAMMNPNAGAGAMPDLSSLPGRAGAPAQSGAPTPPPGAAPGVPAPPAMPDLNSIPK